MGGTGCALRINSPACHTHHFPPLVHPYHHSPALLGRFLGVRTGPQMSPPLLLCSVQNHICSTIPQAGSMQNGERCLEGEPAHVPAGGQVEPAGGAGVFAAA